MDDALAQWLALREPTDAASRSIRLTSVVGSAIAPHTPLRALDLATGTGSNIRYLMRRFSGQQRWLAVDRNPRLLAELRVRMTQWGSRHGLHVQTNGAGWLIRGEGLECHVETRQLELGTLDAIDLFVGRHLVTASALLDLVSERWLRSLAARCRETGAAALFAITYNGRSSCSPREPEDDLILDLFNRHQRADKGLGGPAAGPDAVACAARCFTEAGYHVQIESSDWKLGSHETNLQRQLINGWAEAAAEIEPGAAARIAEWRIRRLRHVDAGRSQVVVGHDDIAASPRVLAGLDPGEP